MNPCPENLLPPPDSPPVTDRSALYWAAGTIVTVVGRYEQHDIRMRRVEPDVRHAGHAGIVLADGTIVLLLPPYEDGARRDRGEIDRWEHQQVRVSGRLADRLSPLGAWSLPPCLLNVCSIEPA